jgi:hypothetical protein
MPTASIRSRIAALREPRRAARVARGLWIAWAVIVWNVVFDHIIVVAGRQYLYATAQAANLNNHLRMDDWMRPAVSRGLLTATAVAGAILAVGLVAVHRTASKTS